MDFWKQLINTALLGTDKQTLTMAQLPPSIQHALQGVDTSDKEAFFLRTAALAATYVKAGADAPQLTIPAVQRSEAETQAYISAKAIAVWRKLVKAERRNPALMEYWLDACIRKEQIATPDIVPSLLNVGVEKSNYALRDKIRKVMGKRGFWLASFNPAWSYCMPVAPATVWKEGTTAQRKEVFEKIRGEDPDMAREWLEKAWPEETAKDRKEFILSLAINLSLADEPFLQQAWEEVNRQPNPKAIHQEIKTIATILLLSLPDSALSTDIWEKAKGYFHIKNSKSKAEGPEVSLQLVEDEFLSEATMHGKFGFDLPVSNRLPTAEQLVVKPSFWLQSLLPFIHPNRWQTHFNLSMQETVAVFTGKLQGEEIEVNAWRQAFAKAVINHKSADWATILLAAYGDTDHLTLPIVGLLPPAEIEAWYQQKVDIGQPGESRTILLQSHRQRWSMPFTRYVLTHLYKSIGNWSYTTTTQQFLSDAVLHIPDGIIPELEAVVMPEDQEWQKQQWREKVVGPLTQLIEYRQEIEAAFQ